MAGISLSLSFFFLRKILLSLSLSLNVDLGIRIYLILSLGFSCELHWGDGKLEYVWWFGVEDEGRDAVACNRSSTCNGRSEGDLASSSPEVFPKLMIISHDNDL
ncbi:hypothetical protein I3843_01G186200 [Carya illinoinensis]|nr:hypothetical protein I3843_01G186200 [Carya illinoinensis]